MMPVSKEDYFQNACTVAEIYACECVKPAVHCTCDDLTSQFITRLAMGTRSVCAERVPVAAHAKLRR